MHNLIKKKGALLCLSFMFISAYAAAWITYQDADSLLKKAKSTYSKRPSEGIRLARQVYHSAHEKNNVAGEIKSLNSLAKFYWQSRSYDSARVYCNIAIATSEKHEIDSLAGDSWLILGIVDYSEGHYMQAIERYNKSVLFYKKAGKPSRIAKSYLNIGICEQQLSKYDEAIKYSLQAAALFENLNDNENLANTYKSIAISFGSLNNYAKAIEYNKKALVIRQNLKDTLLIAQSLNNIGFAFKEARQLDSAVIYLSKCIALYRKQSDSSLLIFPLQNLGSTWKLKGRLNKAESYILRSKAIAAKYSMQEEMARGDLDLAELYFTEKKYDEALVSVKATEKAANELKIPELLMLAYAFEYNLYNQKGDYKKALYYSNRKNELKDSLFTVQKNQTIEELDFKYQTSQKEKDIAALRVQNNLETKIVGQQRLSITMLIVAAFLLLLLFAIAYNSFRIKNKANMRIQTLMQDMHHRVKNNLQILSGLFTMQIENLSDEKTKNTLRENEARLTSMNLIHNKLYLDRSTTKIEMEEYLTKLLNHIKDSFGGNRQRQVNLRIEIDHIMFEADKAVAIGLLVNELATNAFKYAFTDKGGEIYLGLKLLERSKMMLTLSDNGIGLETDKIKEKAPSFGLRLVNLMARQLNSTLVVKNDHGMCYQLELKV